MKKTVEGLGQTRRVGESLILVLRPQEAVAAVQAFGQAASDYFAAIADYNRAQFRLFRALGHPAECLAGAIPTVVAPPVEDEKPAQLPPLPDVPPVEIEPGAPVQPQTGVVPSVLPPLPATPATEPQWGPAGGTASPTVVEQPRRSPVVVPEHEQ